MLKTWPIFKRGEVNMLYKNFPESEKRFIEEYLLYRKARGCNVESKVNDIRRIIIQTIHVIGEDYKKLSMPIKRDNVPLKILRNFLAVLNSSNLSNSVKNNLKCDFKIFLKQKFNDWSLRFQNFDDVKLVNSMNEEKLNSGNLIKKEQVEKLVRLEPRIYWKAFLLVQYECGLRTIETRLLKWTDIKFDVDGDISEINIYATKTGKARTVFVKEATFYLKKLKEEQENLNQKSIYVFPAKTDLHISCKKATVNCWFGNLSQRVFGKRFWPYQLRHCRATELYTLADEGKIAEATASRFMGHAKNMKDVYLHLNSDKIKKMLKDQIYNLEELPPEKKHELEEGLEKLEEENRKLEKSMEILKLEQEKLKADNEERKKMDPKLNRIFTMLKRNKSH